MNVMRFSIDVKRRLEASGVVTLSYDAKTCSFHNDVGQRFELADAFHCYAALPESERSAFSDHFLLTFTSTLLNSRCEPSAAQNELKRPSSIV